MNQAEQLQSVVAHVSGGFRADLEEFILAQQEMCEDCLEMLDVAALRAATANIRKAWDTECGGDSAVAFYMHDGSSMLAVDGYMDEGAIVHVFSVAEDMEHVIRH